MRRRQRKDRGSAQVELTPLIDMVFIILIFFIVSSSFAQTSSVTITRPESARSSVTQGTFVRVVIDDAGQLFLDNQRLALGDTLRIASALQQRSSTHIVIEADSGTPLSLFTAVQDACFAAGAVRVDVATDAAVSR